MSIVYLLPSQGCINILEEGFLQITDEMKQPHRFTHTSAHTERDWVESLV